MMRATNTRRTKNAVDLAVSPSPPVLAAAELAIHMIPRHVAPFVYPLRRSSENMLSQ